MISKRRLLAGLAGTTGAMALARPTAARSPVISTGELRGSIDAGAHGVSPNGGDASRRNLERLLADAAAKNMPIFLQPGDYPISGLNLPDGTRLVGIAGATRLVHSGSGILLRAENARRIELSGLVIDGADRVLAGDALAIAHFRGVTELVVENCDVINSDKTGLHLEGCGGRIGRNRISRAAEYGLYAVNSASLSVMDNSISDCGNGGILIHRWETGTDGTMVSGNRIARTGATNGGTGQYGNAINLYRAHDVIVSGNHISDSAFSAIRANSASNAMISGNHCTASGETAIYAEFSFEGAMIAGNLVDGAANGISVVNFNEGGRLATVANNIVRNLRLTGPYTVEDPIFGVGISAEADTAVTGNVVENAPFCGLAFGFGPYLRNVAATGNIVREVAVGCAVTVVEGAGGAIIANNIFQGAKRGAIVGYRWREASTGDLAKSGSEEFGHLTIEGNRVS
ncbi:TIGR03808 family TAT-translocated repetitive protein [Aliirhizobium smilacinae]|uniref:TIGR03808 family TAT-translocated repetitive protein n=1 Tax=Aliirhizobium smilacinae TaxID=1395944 RepID=A0A5C4XR10_9HYPH|nr:TIGR03808 family TAT-translocated repetitive protein [Rhizobium smilacinae]TNM65783.1 TIGR03808 family TAT-translocated repetitive protein [Rhizobium smilacinae]